MIYTLEMLMDLIEKTEKIFDTDLINKAYKIADEAHKGQNRVSGDPYVSHPIAVAYILVELGMDTDCICAALLHDVVEDTDTSLTQIQKEFGHDVSLLVDGVTKLGKVPLSTREEQQAENIRKMFLAMSQDIRVVIIKLADRLHNMRTIEFMPPQKQRDKSLETMEIYAPIAHRLGIRAVKEELEDIALRYLDPVACKEIEEMLEIKKENRNKFIDDIKLKILGRLNEYGLVPHIEGRVKSLYGIYRKVYMAGRAFEEVYDIYAVRVIVSTVIECYNILGIIHDMFQPIPNRFKDYISTPKPNMYQSLHTTLISKDGVPFEIQIRTWDMHYTAEYGIAAHWKYKAGIHGKDKLEERLAWIRQVIEAGQDTEDVEDIVRTIKTDIGSEEVFVFTPRGDVKSLPVGSTVVDFAYAIHSAVGNKMIGAKIDGRIVSLDSQVKTGQIVEILTTNSQNHGPNRAWLKFVKTNEARSKIRSWFKKERREENIIEGKAELEREFKRNYINLDDQQMAEFIKNIAERQHCESVEDFYASIGYGGISLSRIMPRIKDDYTKIIKAQEPTVLETISMTQQFSKKSTSGVIVEGIDNCLVKFSQCCNPLPGDDIIGFITRGHGVSVHKKDCINVISSMRDKSQLGRWISVHWEQNVSVSYRSTLDIIANDRNALLADISIALANFRVPIHELNARELKNGNANIVATIGIAGIEQLKSIMQKISKIEGVISVERSGK
ncbi:MAG: relA [Oscillospiraceae bacterium]|jgi:GTP pyrophosphokinase|nr:relA [Oscillospiraceae bacterium]